MIDLIFFTDLCFNFNLLYYDGEHTPPIPPHPVPSPLFL